MIKFKKNPGKGKWMDENQKYARFLILPVVALILILLILMVAQPSEQKAQNLTATEQGTKMQETEIQTETQTQETSAQGLAGLELKQDEIPELTALVQAYCHAKEDSDPAALARVFGRDAGSEEEQEAERLLMERVSRMVDGYENVSCYYMDGPEADTYVIYPYFEIRYKDASVTMPSLTWAYAATDGDGQFYMTQDLDESTEAYIAEAGKTEAIRNLVNQTQEKQREAIKADEVLYGIYDENARFNAGEDSTVEIILPST